MEITTIETTIAEPVPVPEKPTALLMGSGGAKGAFQIGAWEALAEAGMLTDIRAVAGCSVGALNAVLFALGDLAQARMIWHKIQPHDLLARGSDGAFLSRTGLTAVLDALPLERIGENGMDVWVSVHHIEKKQPVFFHLNGLPAADIRTLLMASSAIPHIYAPERYRGAAYMDGSVTPEGDQCIQPVYAAGHRNLIHISLKTQFSVYGGQGTGVMRRGASNLTERWPDCRITVIKPMHPMGSLFSGTLNFAHERICERMEQGYRDTAAILYAARPQPKTVPEMNAALVTALERRCPTGEAMAQFLQKNADKFAPNVQLPTLGGNVWYDDIYAVDGWRVQQQRTTLLQTHYRILNPQNARAAWVLDPQILLDALRAE